MKKIIITFLVFLSNIPIYAQVTNQNIPEKYKDFISSSKDTMQPDGLSCKSWKIL